MPRVVNRRLVCKKETSSALSCLRLTSVERGGVGGRFLRVLKADDAIVSLPPPPSSFYAIHRRILAETILSDVKMGSVGGAGGGGRWRWLGTNSRLYLPYAEEQRDCSIHSTTAHTPPGRFLCVCAGKMAGLRKITWRGEGGRANGGWTVRS
ncbi:unnamed protein product [Mesocestoides corti]|uniref:Uncharacterized protein n=1 Tax=Mesocestoides corti TaxID=53468 RepID=A0A0R3UAM4_MESCO|nr:unnamed protein product [Mesocestoides corti]